MKLIYKLLFGYLILVVLAFITDYVSFRSYQHIEQTYNQVSEVAVPQIQVLEKIKLATLRIVGSTSEYALIVTERASQSTRQEQAEKLPRAESTEDQDSEEKELGNEDKEEELISEGETLLKENLQRYENLLTPSIDTIDERVFVQKIRTASQQLSTDSARIIGLKKQGITGDAVVQAKEDFEDSERLTLEAINEALETEYEELKNAEGKVHAVISSATRTTTVIDILAVLLALIVGFFISQSVSNRIRKLKDATQSIGAGNLDEHIVAESTDEIGDLARAFNQMTDALKQSRNEVVSAKNFTESIVESMTDLLVVADTNAIVQRANSAASTILGFTNEEVIGQPLNHICAEQDFLSVLKVNQLPTQFATINFENLCRTKDGREIPMSISVGTLRDVTGQPQGLVCVGRDITDSKRAEEKIQASLVEKEVLLKEIHHRVKNNLQIISSLLNMQARKITDDKSRAIFLDSQNRVKSMALIHESLYQSSDLSQIDFDEYLRKLASQILRSYNLDTERIRLIFSSNNLQMSVDAAVPCGLIINELVSNSLKYAFPGQRKGEINITVETNPRGYRLSCADDGIGLPPDFDILQTNSLGLKIVRTLTDQLNGDLIIHTTHGTTFEITFPH